MISEQSVDTFSDSSRTSLAGTLREIPETSRAGNDKLAGSNNKGVEPKQAK